MDIYAQDSIIYETFLFIQLLLNILSAHKTDLKINLQTKLDNLVDLGNFTYISDKNLNVQSFHLSIYMLKTIK